MQVNICGKILPDDRPSHGKVKGSGKLSWEPLRTSLAGFDDVIDRLKIRIANDAPIAPQLEIVREFLKDHSSLAEEDLLAKWNEKDFKAFYDAAIAVRRLAEAVVGLQNQPEGMLRQILNKVLAGSLTQDFSPEQAKDFFYELEVAHRLQEAGFTVLLREPDVVVGGNGLSGELGLACKHPSSAAQIHEHLSKGYRQIAKQGLDGCVVLALDIIVFNEVYDSPPKFLDFRQGHGDRHPLDVANGLVSDAVAKLVAERSKDYPSEREMDGAILTLSMAGIYGSPAGLTSVTAWGVQCDAGNPRLDDIRRLVEALRKNPSGQ